MNLATKDIRHNFGRFALTTVGIGLLLILNRSVAVHRREWAEWVVILALGGFLGNFTVTIRNNSASTSASEAPVLQFVVIKAVTS